MCLPLVSLPLQSAKAYATLRLERMNARRAGQRKRRAELEAKEAEEKAKA